MATMTAVWVLVRVRLRARWRALLGLALLVGVASGAVMAAAVGARRTDTAYSRLLESTRAEDVEVEVGGFDNSSFIDSLARLPQVADMGLESVALVAPDMPGDPPRFSASSSRLQGVMSVDGRVGWTVNRPLILAGRRPDPARADEVGLSESLARRWRVGPGDTIRLRALSPEQLEHALVGERVVPAGPSLVLTVVAVQELPDDLGVNPGAAEGFVSLTPTFYRTHRDRIAHFAPTPRVRLEHGQADVAAFTAAVRRLSGDSAEVSVIARADLAQLVEQATRTQAVALVLFAALAAVAALVVIGQILTRELFLAATGDDTVRALGASRQQLFATTMLPVAMVSAFGALVGAGIAVLASPLMPVGLARRAEPSPGLAVHFAGIGVGIVLTVLLLGAWAAVPAWRLARMRPQEPGSTGRVRATSTVADTAARAGLPASSVVGLRMAFEQGRGPTAVPVRTTLVGVTAGIVALVAALTFGASLDRLLGTPRLYGWNFNAVAGDWTLEEPASRRPTWLAANSHVSAFSAAWFSRVLIDGTEVYAAGIDTANGRVFPTIVEGHEPDGPNDIVLGTRTLRQLGRRLGQTVEVAAGRSVTMRIVGRSALLTGEEEKAGTGAVLTLEGLQRLDPARGSGYGVFYIRYAPGADAPAALRSLQQPSAGPEQDVLLPRAPTDVENLGRVGGLPGVLAGLLALLAASALAHLLLTSIRRRGHDLAILKTLGFVRRQVSAVVAWQATTVAMVAVVIGVPLGVALGRSTWSLLIDRIGLSAEPVTPGPTLLAGVLGAMLVANLVAVWPGRVAARTRPVVALRSE
jgi:ABC-type lipoprotein release transport system permease subunit